MLEVVSIPGKGRGIIAKRVFEPGDIIERCPLIFLREKEADFVKQHGVLRYYAIDLTANGRTALHLGFGMLYNHSSEHPNAEVRYQAGDDFLLFVALVRISPGEEIVYDYQFEDVPEYMPEAT